MDRTIIATVAALTSALCAVPSFAAEPASPSTLLAPLTLRPAPSIALPYHDDDAVRLDGLPTEPMWRDAVPLDGFTTYEPRDDIPARFAARGLAVRTAEALYIYVRVDVGRAELFANLDVRDTPPSGDYVEVQLDPFGTSRRAFHFGVGAAGLLYDAIVDNVGNRDPAWDTLFDARTHQAEDHWSVELRIPFQSLRFPPGRDRWRMHVFAHNWRHQQALSWAPIERDVNNRLTLMGRAGGFENAKPGRAIELLPSLTGSWDDAEVGRCDLGWQEGRARVCGVRLQPGLSGKWAITPSMSLDAVLNPDFSQVEADASLLTVNNRFALRLQERRPFFIEGLDLYDTPFQIVYTRAIGEPLAAAKLAGTAGGWRTGALIAWDRAPPSSINDDGFSPTGDAAVERGLDEVGALGALTGLVRLQRDLGKRASVGALAAHKSFLDPPGGAAAARDHLAWNTVGGVDARANPTARVRTRAAFFGSTSSDLAGNERSGLAGHAFGELREDAWRVQSRYEVISDGFRSEPGFIPRRGFHNFFQKLDGYYRSENDWGRLISPGLGFEGWLFEDGRWWERQLLVNTFWLFGNRVYVFPAFFWTGERVFPVGGSRTDSVWLDGKWGTFDVAVRTWRAFELTAKFDAGDTFVRDPGLLDGAAPFVARTVSGQAGLLLRPSTWMSVDTTWRHRLIWDRQDGSRIASQPIVRSKWQVFLNRDLRVRYIGEWRGSTDRLFNDLLLAYNPFPGTVLFLGYREVSALGPWRTDERAVFAKASWLFLR